MSELKLYSSNSCPFAHRSRLMLYEKGINFELIEIDLKNKPDWFASVSLYTKVPALEQGDVRIYESAIVNEYIDRSLSDAGHGCRKIRGAARLRVFGSTIATPVSHPHSVVCCARPIRRRDRRRPKSYWKPCATWRCRA